MSSTPASPAQIQVHHEHSPWLQRNLTLLAVIVLHVVAIGALLVMKVRANAEPEPPVLTVQWVPTEKPAPPRLPEPPRPTPHKERPEPIKRAVEAPQVKPVETPMIQAPAETVATAVEAPPAPPAPPTPPAPQPVAAPTPPVELTLKPEIDCTSSPAPAYPAASLRLGEEGRVMLRMQIDERGRPLRVEILRSSNYTRLDRAARDTIASSWVCPMRKGRQGIGGWVQVPVEFVL